MMREGYERRLMAYWDRRRGAVAYDDYITATVLINEVKKMCVGQGEEVTAERAYASLLEAADRIGVRNPFRDKDHFFFVYRESLELKKRWRKKDCAS